MAFYTTKLYANAFISGTVASPANALGSPDGITTTDSGGASWTGRWAMQTTPEPAVVATYQQEILLWMAAASGLGGGTITGFRVYQNGTLILDEAKSIYISTGTIQAKTMYVMGSIFNGTADNVEVEVITEGEGGKDKNSLVLDSIEWRCSNEVIVQAGTSINAWNGTAWVAGELKRWDGTTWIPANVKKWDGTAWVVV